MSIKLEIDVDIEKIIDVLNFLDQKGITADFDQHELYQDLVENKKFNEIEFFIDSGEFPIQFVGYCGKDDNDIVEFLIEKNQAQGNETTYFLMEMINSDSDSQLVRTLFNTCEDDKKELANSQEGLPLIKAAISGQLEIIKLLQHHGARIKYCSEDPIIGAITNGHVDIVKYLLKTGSNLESITIEHLQTCIKKGYISSTAFILSQFDDILSDMDHDDLTDCLTATIQNDDIDTFMAIAGVYDDIDYDELLGLCKRHHSTEILDYLKNMGKKIFYRQINRNINDYSDLKITKGGVSF